MASKDPGRIVAVPCLSSSPPVRPSPGRTPNPWGAGLSRANVEAMPPVRSLDSYLAGIEMPVLATHGQKMKSPLQRSRRA